MPDENKSFLRELLDIVKAVTPMQWVASLIGLLTIGGMVWVIATGANFFEDSTKARGLITFSVAIVTVAIALLLVLYLVLGGGTNEELKDRFTFGKDILLVFVGILGTIMGFYYGADKVSNKDVAAIAAVVQKPASQPTNNPEKTALDLLLKKDFEGATKGFDDAYNATPTLANIGNIDAIRKLLATRKDAYTKADDAGKQKIWQEVFCEISDNRLTVGMTDEMKKTDEGYCKPSASPVPSLTTP